MCKTRTTSKVKKTNEETNSEAQFYTDELNNNIEQKLIKEQTEEFRELIINHYNNDSLDILVENAFEIVRDSGRMIKKIYFSGATPIVRLDMCCQRGYVIGEGFGYKDVKRLLPHEVKEDIMNQLEDL